MGFDWRNSQRNIRVQGTNSGIMEKKIEFRETEGDSIENNGISLVIASSRPIRFQKRGIFGLENQMKREERKETPPNRVYSAVASVILDCRIFVCYQGCDNRSIPS